MGRCSSGGRAGPEPDAEASKKLFTQSLALCAQAGLVSLGRVALDGSKIRASASRNRAMSDDQMVRAEGELAAEVEALLAAGHLPVPFAGLGEDSGLLLPSLDRAGTVRTAEMRLRK